MNPWQDDWEGAVEDLERAVDDEVCYTPPTRLKRVLVLATRHLAALGFLGFVGVTIWAHSVSSAEPNPDTGQTIRESMHYGEYYYLTPLQDAWSTWGYVGTAVLALVMLFAHRLIATYDPVAANLPPRAPGVDPFAGPGKR